MFKARALAAAFIFTLFASAHVTSAQTTTATTPVATQTPAPSPSAATTATPAATPNPNAGHEYAPLAEKALNYKDWTFNSVKDGAPVNLREWMKGKKLVMVVYFAPWCGNWKMEAPVVARLYDKYKSKGFDVIAVSNYAPAADTQKYFEGAGGAPYTVVVESESRDARDKTAHYAYRQVCEDKRRWGSPFNVFLEPASVNKDGEILAEKAWVVGGELIEEEVEEFVRRKLGVREKASVESRPGGKQ